MKPILVKDLKGLLARLPKKYENHVVLVSDDEEGNGFHALFDKIYLGDEKFDYVDHQTNEEVSADTLILI